MPPPQSSCPPSDSELPVCSSSHRRRCHRQDTVSPVVEIRTGASLTFSDGLANTPSLAWRPRLHFLVPSLAPAITQCPLVASGRRIRHAVFLLYSLEILYKLFPVPKVSDKTAFSYTCFWDTVMLLASAPVSVLSEESANAPAPVSAGGPSAASASGDLGICRRSSFDSNGAQPVSVVAGAPANLIIIIPIYTPGSDIIIIILIIIIIIIIIYTSGSDISILSIYTSGSDIIIIFITSSLSFIAGLLIACSFVTSLLIAHSFVAGFLDF
ncbi:hypothetical protein CRENBAI_019081 [Crenichthys baileyi]|uniref:Uncharacterized protein n=1 Tax=Crenichthys baileyi TaxID=28760 RepID=A0AAV9R709_9TELE